VDDVWIGTGCRILDGVTIGKGAIIGTGRVVVKSIPSFSIALGMPAMVIKTHGAGEDSVDLPPVKVVASSGQGLNSEHRK
jgi:acetyltransferase-like isoleucine patch superfamily enzyme